MTKFKYAFDDNKRYHTWNYYLRNTFGEKIFKVSINAGFIPSYININFYYIQISIK